MSRPIIATGFIADSAATASEFPSVGRNSADPVFQAVYWRCIAVFFHGARLNNPGAELMLFSNLRPPVVDDVDVAEMCDRLGVLQVPLALTHRLDGTEGPRRWGSVFFVLDILRWLSEHRSAARFALFDSDVVMTAPLDGLFASLDHATFAGLRLDYPPDHLVNGLTPADAATVAARFAPGFTVSSIPIYGGELLAADIPRAREHFPTIASLWEFARDSQDSELAIRTEEHFWSILFATNGISVADDHRAIKRIWTSLRFSNVEPGDETIPVWHLPAEKRFGFRTLFRELARHGFPVRMDTDTFRRLAQNHFGVPAKNLRKYLSDGVLRGKRMLRLS